MADQRPFKVRIVWGSASIRDTQEPCEYEFTTLDELSAFLHGVDEANGWLDYDQIDPNPDGTWPNATEDAADDLEEE